ncbi:MAG: hypothetical protein MK106_03125 [Mariniblastus sp.]|nr:hypothetical protein [Mariniblastus sp.]
MIGNRVTEKDIRLWLQANGFSGQSAHFEELELYAIRRPGWLQIYRFKASVTRLAGLNNERTEIFGVVRDDETKIHSKNRLKIMVFEDANQCNNQLTQWSQGLIQLRSGDTSTGWWFWPAFLMLVLVGLWLVQQLS